MKQLAMVAVCVALGCGGKPAAVGAGGQGRSAIVLPESARRYPVTRYLPDRPSYALVARSVRDAQRSLRDAIDGLGVIAGVDASTLGKELERIYAIDPFDADALARIGVDLEAGLAVFSEAINPTFVVRLKSPGDLQRWVDTLRGNGLSTSSVMVDGAEVFTTRGVVDGEALGASWVVVDDWCWVHLELPGQRDDEPTWFTASRRPAAASWVGDWEYAHATGGAAPAFLGFFDLKRALAAVVPEAPEAIACAKLLDPVARVAVSIDGDTRRVGAKLAFDLGPAAAGVARTLLPRPEGWDAAAATAAIAVEWNADLGAVRAWSAPCAQLAGLDWRFVDELGVRGGRAMLHDIDVDGPDGRGVASLELTSKRYFAGLLDQVPLRRTVESKRTFGPHRGAHISIPFGPKLDYVLTDQLALAAMGDGLLMQVIGAGKVAPGPLAALHVAPPRLPRATWLETFALVDDVGWVLGRRFVEQMLRWKEGHVTLGLDGTRLVLTATGTRL